MATATARKKFKWFWWVLCLLGVALLLAVPFFRPLKVDLGNKSISVSLQTLAPNGLFNGVFIRAGWDGPTGSFNHGETYGIKLGNRLLRLDIVTDPIAAAQRRLPKTLAGIIATLDSEDGWLKFCAMRALADMGAAAQPALPALLNALERGDAPVEDALLRITKASGEAAVPALTNGLASRTPVVRQRAAEMLAEVGPNAKASIAFLEQRFHDEEPRVVVHSAMALWKVDSQTHGAVPVLVKLLVHDNPEVRALAAAALGEFGSEAAEAAPALLQRLEDTNSEVRAMSARTLGLIGPSARSAVPGLMVKLDDSDGDVLMWTCSALGQLGEDAKAAIPKLREIARRADSGRWAVEALGSMGPEAVPSLVEVYQDTDGGNCWFAAQALMKLGPKAGAATPQLLEDLNGTNAGRVVLAAQVLGHLGEDARIALPRLAELIHDDDEDIRLRVRAAGALWRLDRQTNAVLPVLLAALKDTSIHGVGAKRFAAETLGEMGPAAKDARPFLQTMLQDQQFGLRGYAAEALGKITGRPADAE